ncbi:MucBP domain-containing protein [Enterococcus ureilyticus]|uniref:MucBP domain-containing protein n=1 Tax=Enterococcus ureilyticus TaxID=1131292 RepID=UPI001A914BAB|nr:MucBP domain-containing protein [Enterococcus ureilyticus]MBO0446104.1 MucBP domain-containing protein [Enterococcus ureilyticus]
MKNRNSLLKHKKNTAHSLMLLTLLAPTLLSSSLVFAEGNATAMEQTEASQVQESTNLPDATLDSSETVGSSSSEDVSTTSTLPEPEPPLSTTDTTIHEETPAVMITPRADTITIADPILKQTIVSTLGLPAGSELTQADMDRLTNLSLASAQISSLAGLEHATNLGSIYINTTNNVTDFSPLEQLSALTYVTLQTKSLTSDNFPDLTKSAGITNLSLGSTSIDDNVLPKIAQLTQLSRIYLDSNMNITTIEPLTVLPNLKSLSVQFCGITDFTVVPAFPMLSDLAAFGQNTGRNDSPTTMGRSAFDYDFEHETLFLPFSMMPNRMTNFDGYIPPFTLSSSASNTYLDFNGTQLPANRLQITDQGITVTGVTEEEFKNLASIEYNARLDNPAGSYAQPPGFTFYAISSGTYLHQFNILDDGQPVMVHYQDSDGNELLPDKPMNGLVGQSFEVLAPAIPDYELVETIGNTTGSYTNLKQEVTFIYKKVTAPIIGLTGKVTSFYIDATNKEIIPSIEQKNPVGMPFTTDKLEFEGYTFKEVKGDTSGFFTEKDQIVTYVYTKNLDQTKPTTSTETTTKEKTVEAPQRSSTSTSTSQKVSPTLKKKLPATGEKINNVWLFLGLALIGFTNYRFVLKKGRQEK